MAKLRPLRSNIFNGKRRKAGRFAMSSALSVPCRKRMLQVLSFCIAGGSFWSSS
jgi:hypothetical protein